MHAEALAVVIMGFWAGPDGKHSLLPILTRVEGLSLPSKVSACHFCQGSVELHARKNTKFRGGSSLLIRESGLHVFGGGDLRFVHFEQGIARGRFEENQRHGCVLWWKLRLAAMHGYGTAAAAARTLGGFADD